MGVLKSIIYKGQMPLRIWTAMAKTRVTKALIEEVVSEAVGEDALDIIFYLKGKEDISEFTIAEDLDIEIHQVRNILYRLHSQHLVTYRRKKDRQKGWYISYWTFNKPRVRELRTSIKEKKLDKFKERLEKEEANKGNYFMCPNACTRMDFGTATEHDFKCPECGELLQQQDNTRTIERLQDQIKSLEKELAAA